MPKKIAVIGGGFSGTMVIRQLIDLGFHGQITRFHSVDSQTLGPAYQTKITSLLLNVRSQNMSAFPDKPDDFCSFLRANFPEYSDPSSFVPRKIYGSYLEKIWNETKQLAKEKNIDLDTKQNQSPAFEEYDTVILATGNELPRIPRELPEELSSSDFFHGNPWHIHFDEIPSDKPIFILGNGLTMVDTVLSLRSNGFQHQILSLSRHGFQMFAHPETAQQALETSSPENTDLASLFQFLHLERKKRPTEQLLSMIDAHRSNFSGWWLGFSLEEKKRFLHHLRHLWGSIRHRIPSEIEHKITEERNSGRLEVCAGKLVSVKETYNGLSIHYQINGQEKKGDFACLINCTGPETSISKMNNPVIQTLAKNEWIVADELDYGIKINPGNHLAIGRAPIPIYAMGNLCKGTLWESTAIAELRSQAKLIAKGIMDIN